MRVTVCEYETVLAYLLHSNKRQIHVLFYLVKGTYH